MTTPGSAPCQAKPTWMPGSTEHDGNEPHRRNGPTCRRWRRTATAPATPAKSQPGSERPTDLIRLGRSRHRKETLLEYLFRRCAIGEHCPGKTIDRLVISGKQGIERLIIATTKRQDQLVVRHRIGSHHLAQCHTRLLRLTKQPTPAEVSHSTPVARLSQAPWPFPPAVDDCLPIRRLLPCCPGLCWCWG